MEIDTGELLKNTYSGFHKSGQFGFAILADNATIATGSKDFVCILYDLVWANRVQFILWRLQSGMHEFSRLAGGRQ
jgi:hypothetical protein